ncbi:alpha/beta hydrolase fold domain-containing protein [Silicimonas sp. MF1-12-2]|uniref:alpha/beta hydrolase fold domain-containing protein n=1 Tax=Silicimonas sp. MF1-12-2 TaxID=3384793 RepID=UPI0039B36D23
MSARLTALNLLLRTVGRPLLKRTKTPERARRDFDLAARWIFLGPRTNASRRVIAGVPVLDVRPPSASGDAVLLYFHGGGYITGNAASHLPMVGSIAGKAGLRAVLPDYGLAPERPFPAAFEDALATWNGLRNEGTDARRIVLGGDSAGGGLALALLAHLLAAGERPAGLFAFSPWTDLTLGGETLRTNARSDLILPVERIEELRTMVAPQADLADPRLSPLFAGFEGAPPVYLQASRTEILLDDTLRIERRLRNAGVDTQVDLWPDAPHVWQLFRSWIPEADEALDRTAEFVRRCLKVSIPQA